MLSFITKYEKHKKAQIQSKEIEVKLKMKKFLEAQKLKDYKET